MEQLRIKYVFLGDEGIGKTSLILRYTHGIFLQYSESTIGCAFNAKPIKIDNTDVRIDIWDTAGQERYRAMMPMYYRNSDVVFLCVDLSKISVMETFNSWYVELSKHNDNEEKRIIYLVGTKSDIKTDLVMKDIDTILNTYPFIKFIETSSKKNENIGELFTNSAQVFMDGLEYISEQTSNKKTLAIVNTASGVGRSWFKGVCNIL